MKKTLSGRIHIAAMLGISSPIALHWTQLFLQTFRKVDITMVL